LYKMAKIPTMTMTGGRGGGVLEKTMTSFMNGPKKFCFFLFNEVEGAVLQRVCDLKKIAPLVDGGWWGGGHNCEREIDSIVWIIHCIFQLVIPDN
jgi:hypothetical protein